MTERPDAVPGGTRAALHIGGLWALAVATPVFLVLQRNPEFFVAHRAGPLAMISFAAVVAIGAPAVLWLVRVLAGLAWPLGGRLAQVAIVGVLATVLASQLLAGLVSWPTVPHAVVAAVIGAALAWWYATREAARLCASLLAVGVILSPLAFLLQPRLAEFVRPRDPTARAAAPAIGETPPIVMVVFDQLPLVSLLRADGSLDADSYPGFARLAANATWYRNDTTVGELTGWALPAILTGQMPRPTGLPTARYHPRNLFTLLGGRYQLEVVEPVTHLCPDRLCPEDDEALWQQLLGMSTDSAVVLLHVTLPVPLRARLPPLTTDWKNFIKSRHWQARWVNERDSDRRRRPQEFIEGISRTDRQPTLYFLHALLPHEPYMYLRTGQQFTDAPQLVGLGDTGRWTTDEWPVLQAYQAHLTQMRYVDALVGRLLDRLQQEGLYDRSLIVVTGDHGVSFQPGRPFKGVVQETLADIMSVPLFIKLPGQRDARLDDRNAQSVDIVPTIADALDAELSAAWSFAGQSLLVEGQRDDAKTLYHTGATRRITVETSVLDRLRDEAVLRRVRTFGRAEAPYYTTPMAAVPDLVGRSLTDLDVRDDGPVDAVVDQPDRLHAVDLHADVIPALLSGRAFDEDGQPAKTALAIAINGVVSATTETYGDDPGTSPGYWSALVDPRAFRAGDNDVQVFAVQHGPRGVVLERAYASTDRPDELNLSSRAASEFWSVDQSGMYEREGDGLLARRWTTGHASLSVPLDANDKPRSLRVALAAIHEPRTPFRVAVGGCTLFDGRVDAAPWQRTFPLDACASRIHPGNDLLIELESGTGPVPGSREGQNFGVAISAVNLFDDPWPAPVEPAARGHAIVHALVAAGTRLERGSMLSFVLHNSGTTTWLSPADTQDPHAPIDVLLRWHAVKGGDHADQRLTLPWAVHPGDRIQMDVALVPPPRLETEGPWDVEIAPASRDGATMPVEAPSLTRVVPADDDPGVVSAR